MRKQTEIDESVVKRFEKFGYEKEKLALLFLLPFIEVAWAEGFLQPVERRAVLRLATQLGVRPRHPVYEDLLELLAEPPSEEFCADANGFLREFLDKMPREQSDSLLSILQIGCFRVARAAGDVGFFKQRSRITPEERAKIDRLGETLQFSHVDYLD